jgi:Tol biopolymer transport system component
MRTCLLAIVLTCAACGGDDTGRNLSVAEGALWGARFSPDGRTLAVAYGDMDKIGTLDVDTGALTERAGGGSYLTGTAWSAAGDAFYFSGDAGISRVSLAGGAATMVADAFAALSLDLSPDGTRFAYGVNGGNARIYTIATNTERALDRPCEAIRFAPSGDRVACISRGALLTIDLATDAATIVVASDVPFIAGLDWFADGQRLVFTSNRGIETVTLAGARTVVTDAFAAIEVDLSADDRTLVYQQNGTPELTLLSL